MKLLVIEDDERLAQVLKRSLVKEGYAVDHIADGDAGLLRIELHHKDYALVILDLNLPGKNGFEVCKEVREKHISLPILILTAQSDVSNKITGLDLGADDFLIKPFSFEELSARIRAIMRRPVVSLPSEIVIRDLVLNPNTRKVFRAGREITLTLKEFRILEYLMRHPNEVVSRDQLLDALWDFSHDSFSNIVDVHMKNLRKKIEKRNAGKLVETVQGVGYSLRA